MVYRFDENQGSLTANDPAFVATAAGAGPRHFAFHPNGRFAYVINELDSTVVVCACAPESPKASVTRQPATRPIQGFIRTSLPKWVLRVIRTIHTTGLVTRARQRFNAGDPRRGSTRASTYQAIPVPERKPMADAPGPAPAGPGVGHAPWTQTLQSNACIVWPRTCVSGGLPHLTPWQRRRKRCRPR